jgi:hypothetical protein
VFSAEKPICQVNKLNTTGIKEGEAKEEFTVMVSI